MKQHSPLLIFLLLLLAPFPAFALEPLEIAAAIQGKYEGTAALTAHFEQESAIAGLGGRKQLGQGTLAVKKPGKLRWDYKLPAPQVLICDGEEVSLYLAQDKQMIVSRAEEYLNEDLTYAFFVGKGNISKDFKVEGMPPELAEPGHHGLRLTPNRHHGQVQYLLLWVDEAMQITHIRIVDHLQSTTDIRLSQIRLNGELSDSLFDFAPPKGTEIILQ
ncbi:MAG: outer membrane lipoprotein carrier protein LolA [Thermodesulfobacteriota bacterium]